jgi:hypothetical protein
MIEAHADEKARQFEADHKLTAWLAMQIMNTQGTLKRPVTLDKMLGKKKRVKKQTTENRDRMLTELLKKFGD